MYHAAYASVLSSLSTPDLQRTFCIAPNPICTPPPAAAPYSLEPVSPFTASAPPHGELCISYTRLYKLCVYSLIAICLSLLSASAEGRE